MTGDIRNRSLNTLSFKAVVTSKCNINVWFVIRYWCSRISWRLRVWCLSTLRCQAKIHHLMSLFMQIPTYRATSTCSIRRNMSQSENTSSLYVRHKTGKVCACFVFASTSKVTAMYVFIFSCQAMFTGPGMPVSFYRELFFRFGSTVNLVFHKYFLVLFLHFSHLWGSEK